MLSFYNDPAVKAKYLARIRAHEQADNIIRGTGWDGHRGCAVGCTLENYDHSRYPIELGVPEWLARLEDKLFEGMSAEKSKTWPRIFLDAVPIGISEERFESEVKAQFLIHILESVLKTFDHHKYPDVKKVVDASIALWKRDDIGSQSFENAARAAARKAAWAAAAAEAAAEAAWAAAWAAWAAASAAWAAWAAAWAAAEAEAAWAARKAAAWAAWAEAAAARAAAWAEAEAAKFDSFADYLLTLLKGMGDGK
jgi:hypothetical protein